MNRSRRSCDRVGLNESVTGVPGSEQILSGSEKISGSEHICQVVKWEML